MKKTSQVVEMVNKEMEYQVQQEGYSQGRKLKILQVAPPVLPVGKYGGAERVIRDLDKHYTKKGHDSYIVCSEDSKVEGTKISPLKEALWTSNKKFNQQEFDEFMESYSQDVLQSIKEFGPDIVHEHMGFVKSDAFAKSKGLPPILSTLHASANYHKTMEYSNVDKNSNGNKVFFNTVSYSQKRIFDRITDVDFVIYNGIDTESFPFQADKRDYVFFMSSIYPEKGAETAINAANELGKKVVVAGPVHFLDDESKNKRIRDYWDNYIKPRVDFFGDPSTPHKTLENFLDSNKRVMYTGELDSFAKKYFHKNAEAFYAPIDLEEAFGLSMMEANTCGTPVVAYKRGAVPEIIEQGKNGYQVYPQEIVNFIDYASRADELSPYDCRSHVEENFGLERQVDKYLEIYGEILENAMNPLDKKNF